MTENKRFEIKDEGWHTIYDNEKNEYVISDGMLNAHHYCNGLCNLLNELHNEKQRLYEDNIRVKQLVADSFNNERTAIGRSVLKQLLEQI